MADAADVAAVAAGTEEPPAAPEDRREASEVGRRARLELVFACRGGRTVLADAYAEPPFRVGHTFSEGAGLHMIMASSAPGIFAGDRFEQVVRVEPGARVRLTSQSSLQAHGSFGRGPRSCEVSGVDGAPGDAETSSVFHVADAASLSCQWDPMIPFSGARLRQRIDIRVSDTARLYWSDAFMAGRAERGERWLFASLSHELRVTRGATLEYLERYQVRPESSDPTGPWVAAACAYVGTTLAVGHETTASGAEALHRDLAAIEGLRSAVDLLTRDVVVARLMAPAGPAFHDARARLCRVFDRR